MVKHVLFINSDNSQPNTNVIEKNNPLGNRIKVRIQPEIILGRDPKLYIIKAHIVWTIKNLRSTNNIIRMSRDGGVTFFNLVLTPGIYDLDSINEEVTYQLSLIDILLKNAIVFSPVEHTQSVLCTINMNFIAIDWPNSSIAFNLGFQTNPLIPAQAAPHSHLSQNIANLNTIKYIGVHVDCCASSFSSVSSDSSLCSIIYPDVNISESIMYEPYAPLLIENQIFKKSISELTIWLTDYLDRDINMNNEIWSLQILITSDE